MRILNPRCAAKLENSVVIDGTRRFPCQFIPNHEGPHRWADKKNQNNFIVWEIESDGTTMIHSMRTGR